MQKKITCIAQTKKAQKNHRGCSPEQIRECHGDTHGHPCEETGARTSTKKQQ